MKPIVSPSGGVHDITREPFILPTFEDLKAVRNKCTRNRPMPKKWHGFAKALAAQNRRLVKAYRDT